MHRFAAVVLIVSCGRVGFAPIGDAPPPDALETLGQVSCSSTIVLRPTGDAIDMLGSTFECSGVWPTHVPDNGPSFDKVADVIADDDATYVASATDRQCDEYTHPSFTIAPTATIDSVTVWIRARIESDPTGCPGTSCTYSQAAQALTSASTRVHSDAMLTLTYADYSHAWSADPHTGMPWTIAAVNAMTFGVRKSYPSVVLPSGATAHITQVWAEVACTGP